MMAMSLRDAKVADDLGADPLALLTDWYDWGSKVGRNNAVITLTGGVLRTSSLGYLIRLGWVSARDACVKECWDYDCPQPDGHRREYRMTSSGNDHAESLLDSSGGGR